MRVEYPLISIVIPTHNRASFLPGLLAALDRQDYPSYEVIVVDDASQDGTAAVLQRWQRDARRLIRLRLPSGSYAARNVGWRAARGDVVAFTDDDCLPSPGWLSGLAERFLSGDWAGVQGMTLAEPGESTPFTHEIEQTRPGPPYRTCNIAYRRDVLEREGGFDDRLRWYADNLLGLRIGRERIGFAKDAIVFHPPRPREWRTYADWLERFRADALYREELLKLGNLSRVAPPRTLPVVLWIVRPLVKQTLRHLGYLIRHPWRYARGVRPMVREKLELLRALAAYERLPSGDRGESLALPPLPPEPLVSVVIVTRAGQTGEEWRAEMLEGALAALERQTWPRREVVVVAHGESAAVEEIASRHGARFAVSGGTLAQARQSGVEAAHGEIVAFTDDDCVPSLDWLERAAHDLRGNRRLWGVQGRTVAESGPPGTHAIRVDAPARLYQTCNMAYRRDALCRAGGFDPAFDGWFEDTALGARVSAQGEIGWDPQMVVTHRAVLRRSFDRATWRRVLADERRLAERYPALYRRVRGPSFLVAVLGRWLIGSTVKTLWYALPGAVENPRAYGDLVRDVLRERGALLMVLFGTPRSESQVTPYHDGGSDCAGAR